MKTFLIIIVSITSIFITDANAQIDQYNKCDEPTIEVNGTAELKVIPDEIFVEFTLKERITGRNKITLEELKSNLIEKLKNIGINLDDLYLSGSHTDYVRLQWKKDRVKTSETYEIMVNDAKTLVKVFQLFDEIEIPDARIKKVSHSEIDKYRKEVRIMAMKAAKEKADYMLEAIGEETGKPLVVNEVPASDFLANSIQSNIRASINQNQSYYYEDQGFSKTNKYGDIGFAKIIIKTSVYIKFLIK